MVTIFLFRDRKGAEGEDILESIQYTFFLLQGANSYIITSLMTLNAV